jgi:hypothetical protein
VKIREKLRAYFPGWWRIAIAALAGAAYVISFTGCSREDRADGRILKDSDGCAYLAREGPGQASFITRLRDADDSTCKAAAL